MPRKKKKVTRKPKFEPTEKQRKLVQSLIGYGLKVDDARLLIENEHTGNPVSKDTLYRHFRPEIESGQAIANSLVLETAHKIATNPRHRGCVPMNIFWQKTRMGFKETERHEHTGKDGEELGPSLVINTGKRVKTKGKS